jgi:3-phenylpropionate/trans-cinnamate dioxygenase ferredoxin subunit/naphthalene 1,2-dioxygenase system ferredoxin subunit
VEDYQWVAETEDVPPGALKAVRPGGTNVLLANVDGDIYAVSNFCTHSKCFLHKGKLKGKAVTCPCHFAQFDVTTGEALAPPAKEPLPTYPVKTDGSAILVAV